MSGIVGNLPVQLQNGTTGDASQVMADLNYIVNQVNANGLSPAGLQKASGIFSVDTGTVNAYNGAYTPAITSYVQGMTLLFIPANTNTATNPTFGAGAAVYPIFKSNGQPVDIGDIQAGMVCILQYSPTINANAPGWILLNPALAWIQEVSGLALKSPTLATPTLNGGSWTYLPSGTRMLFQQAAVPAGWTQDTTVQNDSLLRMVNGAGGGVYAGTSGVSAVLRGAASTDDTTLTVAQIPSHSHGVTDPGHSHPWWWGNNLGWGGGGGAAQWGQVSTNNTQVNGSNGSASGQMNTVSATGISIQDTGGSGAHLHTLSTLNINSIDIIVGVKN